MLIHHVIFLLLTWRCVRSIGTEKPKSEDIFDQIATASENLGLSFENPDSFSKSSTSPSTPATKEGVTIHYENSNGFVPITSIDRISSDENQKNSTDESDSSFDPDESSILLEDDPAYSTEARMFLNLPGPSADRRSFDAQDGQNEFEILKVTNETPAIANYHDFYENVQSNLDRSRSGTEGRYDNKEEPNSSRLGGQNHRTKERIKKIEKYLTKFQGEEDLRTSDSYKNYYSFGNANGKPSSQNKAIVEPEKVASNFNQHSTFYDVYSESPNNRQRTSTIPRSNYENTRHTQKSHGSASAKNRHINSKPVVVVEPSDYKLDMKYGTEQTVAKVSNSDHYRNQKLHNEPEVESRSLFNLEDRVNREDRYAINYDRNEDNGDYSEEASEYLEVTEKPKRAHKSKRRPHASETSKRLPKEHRGHQSENDDGDDSRKHHSTRAKIHKQKVKPSYWNEDDSSSPQSEESSEEQQRNVKSTKSEDSSKKNGSKSKGASNWSQIGPNIEVSHSNGFEIDQLNKPKLLVPVNLNLVPFAPFDHSTALGSSQGFDFSNVPNFVTATPIVSTPTPLLSTSQSVITSNTVNPPNAVKNIPNLINSNYGLSTAVPDVIVGQNTYNNPVHALILPQMNVHNKFTSNPRPQYLASTASPMFAVTQPNNNHNNGNPTMSSISAQNYQSTVSPRPATSQNVHHVTINSASPTSQPQFVVQQPMYAQNQMNNHNSQYHNPTVQSTPIQNYQSTVAPRTGSSQNHHHHHQQQQQQLTLHPASPTIQPQFVLPHPTLQSFPFHNPYNGHSNYNIFVNPNGMHGQNPIHHGNQNGHGLQMQHIPVTTQHPETVSNNYLRGSEQQQKNSGHNNDGQFLASASFAVGNEEQQKNNINDNKFLASNQHHVNNNNNNNNNINPNNNNYFNEHHNNQPIMRPHQQQNVYQFYRNDQNSNGKQYEQPIHEAATIIQSPQTIPLHFNNQNYAGGQLHDQTSLNSATVGHRVRDQNQQILKAANDIFQNTWKQLQQLRSNEEATKNNPYQHVYRVNDNLPSTSNFNVNTVNHLQGMNGNQVKAHLPNLGTQNVEIVNPNIKPSPIDLSFVNPFGSLNHYHAVLTTPIPIFTTAATFLTPRPAITSTSPETINLQNYMNSLTQIGSPSNQINKLENKPNSVDQDNQRALYNPINFVPNLDLMKSQSMLNSKLTEPLPSQLSLVPVIPGGNFFKSTFDAQNQLVQKPRLRSDLEKYADEMFKESLKTIYSTHKWNNDRRSRGNFTAADLSDLAKLKGELQRFKASMPDPNFSGKDILEAHQTETKIRTAEPSKTTKKPDLTMAAIEQLFKAAANNNAQTSTDSSQNSRPKNRQQHGHVSSRPTSSNDHSNEFRISKHHLNDYLTPPKPNSFISKSPFNDAPKPIKKRPGSTSRYNSKGSSRPNPRPSALTSRPASNPEASASSHVESTGPRYDKYHHRHLHYSRDKDSHRHVDLADYRTDSNYDSYPTFTTTLSSEEDAFKPSSSEQSSKTDYFDINHPRTHNLLGLLMKNKQLPAGTAQSLFRDEEELKQYFDNEKRRMHVQFYDENGNNFQKKVDIHPINMAPPAPPNLSQIRYYNGQRAA